MNKKVEDYSFAMRGALQEAGLRFKSDRNQENLDFATQIPAKYKFIENLLPDSGSDISIYSIYTEFDESRKYEQIGIFTRFWNNGKVMFLEKKENSDTHTTEYRLLSNGNIEEEKIDHWVYEGNDVSTPHYKREIIDIAYADEMLIKLLKGEEFEANKFKATFKGILPHTSITIPDYKKDVFEDVKGTVIEALESLPDYEKPVAFEFGGECGTRVEMRTNVNFKRKKDICGYPLIKGTIFDAGVKAGDNADYRLKNAERQNRRMSL